MRWFTELAIWIGGGIVLGVIIHIVVVFGIPAVAGGDAWAKLSTVADHGQVAEIEIEKDGTAALPDLDPNFRYFVCRFDLSENPLRVDALVPQDYWSLALYDRRGINYYTINDRAVAVRAVTLWIANKRQLLAIQPEPQEDQEDRLIVGARDDQGFVIFQGLVALPSSEGEVKSALQASSCSSEVYAPATQPQN